MRKIVVTASVVTLVLLLAGSAHASFGVLQTFNDRIFQIDARDEFNRPVEADFSCEQTVFSDTFSELSGFGICSRVESPEKDVKIGLAGTFRVPMGAVPYISGSGRRILQFLERSARKTYSYRQSLSSIITYSDSFESTFQTGTEPRFRVPVFLE